MLDTIYLPRKMEEHIVELKVAEALQNDVGRGIVRIDSESAKNIDVTTGDIVEISGNKSTAAKGPSDTTRACH